jgi:hypothetical protein
MFVKIKQYIINFSLAICMTLLMYNPTFAQVTVLHYSDLSAAGAINSTDTFILCQFASPCTAGQNLVIGTMSQIQTYIAGSNLNFSGSIGLGSSGNVLLGGNPITGIAESNNKCVLGVSAAWSASNNCALLNLADQNLTGGANVTSLPLGTISSGTVTIDCGARPTQYLTDNGAFTLAAPSNDGTCVIFVINSSTAGAISFSGFSVGSNTGDALNTTNGNKFSIFVWRINGTSGYRVAAHQ